MSSEQCDRKCDNEHEAALEYGVPALDSPGELQSDVGEEDEEDGDRCGAESRVEEERVGEGAQFGGQSQLEEQVDDSQRARKQKQEFDIEFLASSPSAASTSSSSSSLQPPAQSNHVPAAANAKRQTFLAAQLAEPNEPGSLGHSAANHLLMSSRYQQLQMSQMPGPRLIGTNSQYAPVKEAAVNQRESHAQQRSHNQQQQQRPQQHAQDEAAANERTSNTNNNNNNIDYDEHVEHVDLFGVKIVALTINSKERLCLAQISNTLLKNFSYNEIHNRRVALGITCVQCTPIQLEMLRRAGAMPSSSRRCGMITMREAERLCRSFLAEEQPPELPENFHFNVGHRINYGCKGRFVPARYISSRAKCIECFHCGEFYSPNKFIFHSHKQPDATDCNPPDSPNINSWRKHINLDWTQEHSQDIKYAWEDVKSLFNGGTRRRAPATAAGGQCLPTSLSAGQAPGDNCVGPAAPESQHRTPIQGGGGGGKAATSTSEFIASHKLPRGALEQQQQQQRQHSEQRALATAAAMSQSERRKLPMSSWPKACVAQVAAASQHQRHGATADATGGLAHNSNGPVKRLAALMSNDARQQQQQQQPKKLATNPWHQQHQLAAANSRVSHAHEQHAPVSYSSEQLGSGGGMYACGHSPTMGAAAAAHHHHHQKHVRSAAQQQQQQHQKTLSAQAGACAPHAAIAQQDQRAASMSYGSQDGSPSAPSSFIYGQLYSQLMQSQLNQQQASLLAASQQRQAPTSQLSTFDAQLALRHHIWSNLLANIRCNPGVFDALANLQQASALETHQHQATTTPTTPAAQAPLQLTNQPPGNHQHHQQQQLNSLLSSDLTATTPAPGVQPSQLGCPPMANQDLSNNQSPPSSAANLSPFQALLLPMRLYGGAPAPGHIGANNGPLARSIFNSGSDSCK